MTEIQERHVKSTIPFSDEQVSIKLVRAMRAFFEGEADQDQQRRIVSWLIHHGGRIYRETFIPGDQHSSSYLSGRRSLVLQMMQIKETTPEDVRKTGETDV